jgi:hypothetical protein
MVAMPTYINDRAQHRLLQEEAPIAPYSLRDSRRSPRDYEVFQTGGAGNINAFCRSSVEHGKSGSRILIF